MNHPHRDSERDDDFWESMAERPWRRVKWRKTSGEPPTETCAVFGTPIHRTGTYYLRPAYTDGEIWISQRAYEEIMRRSTGQRPSRTYGSRSSDEP